MSTRRLKAKRTCFMMATQDCSHFCCCSCSCSCMALREKELRGERYVEGESTAGERAHYAVEGGVKSGGSVPMRFLRARLQCKCCGCSLMHGRCCSHTLRVPSAESLISSIEMRWACGSVGNMAGHARGCRSAGSAQVSEAEVRGGAAPREALPVTRKISTGSQQY